MRQIDLSGLPRDKRNYISWKHSIGLNIPFIYDNIKGDLTIVAIRTNKNGASVLDVAFQNKITTSVPASSIKNCILGRILGLKKFEFVTYVGQHFKDSRRDYIIVDQRRGCLKSNEKYTQREVEILCNKCHTKTWMAEERVLSPRNCACNNCRYSPASGKKSIVETDPWMIPFFPNGQDEAKQYTRGQGKKLHFVCPYCKKPREKAVAISTLNKTHSIGCACSWSTGHSFPERLIKSVLERLNVKYIHGANHIYLDWALDYSYDFYLPDYNVIIEAHGKQHYEEGTGYFKNTLKETQENDENKKKLALENGMVAYNYIVIDCRKSETEYIKNNIIKSTLPDLLNANFNDLDWVDLTQNAWKSEKLSILEYCKDNPLVSVREIAVKFGVSRDLVKEVQVNAGIYNVEKEKNIGVQRQQELFRQKTKERDKEICGIKENNPSFTTNDIAKKARIDRHTVYRILMDNGLYDPQLEKNNKYSNISNSRKMTRETDYDEICKYKKENPSISARSVAKLTGHSHNYVSKIWEENNLI